MSHGVIYQIVNIRSGKSYVGQTRRRNPGDRFTDHKRNALRGRVHPLYVSMRKYGYAAFIFDIIATAENQLELDRLEDEAIRRLGTLYPGGYNLRLGGAVGEFSAAAKLKMSIAAKNAMARPEVLAKHVEALHRKETREKIRLTKSSPESRLAQSRRSREIADRPGMRERLSEDQRRRMSDPKYKAAVVASSAITRASPEYKDRLSTALKQAWSDPERKAARVSKWPIWTEEQRAAARERARELRERPGAKEKHSEAVKANWVLRKSRKAVAGASDES